MKPWLTAFAAGLLFSIGLAVSGMTQPTKVLDFLDLTGPWDPSLGVVMAGAVGVHAVGTFLVSRRAAPLLGGRFPQHPAQRLDAALLSGAALFGIGWGLCGYCPGPALVTASAGSQAALVFVPAMLTGMGLFRLATLHRRRIDEPCAGAICSG